MKHGKEKRGFLPVVTAVLAVAVIVLLVMLLMPENETVNKTDSTSQAKAEQAADQAVSDNSEEVQDVLIETPYCDLFIPADKAKHMRYEISDTESGCEVSFYGTVAEKDEQWLYSFWFGEADKAAFLVGQLEDGMSVSLEMSDFVPGDKWSKEDADELFALQETMNYAIKKLKDDSSFSEA